MDERTDLVANLRRAIDALKKADCGDACDHRARLIDILEWSLAELRNADQPPDVERIERLCRMLETLD